MTNPEFTGKEHSTTIYGLSAQGDDLNFDVIVDYSFDERDCYSFASRDGYETVRTVIVHGVWDEATQAWMDLGDYQISSEEIENQVNTEVVGEP